MSGIKYFNLLLAFLLELCLLVIFGYWGTIVIDSITLKVTLAIGLPLSIALVWGKFLAPASRTRFKEPALSVTKVVIFSLATLALYLTELHQLSIPFGIISIFNLILLYIYR